MIIDCHGHVSAPAELWAYKALILSHRGSHGRGKVTISDEELKLAANKKEMAPAGHLDMLDRNGVNMQLISPRPFQMMHSQKPGRLVHWFTEEVNTIIDRQVRLLPDRFFAVAGLPQVAGEAIEGVFPELRRVSKMGFKGVLLNPDPYENSGVEAPGLGERYWYPLYERLCELGMPAHIHATGSHSDRSPYTLHFVNEETIAVYNLVNSEVLNDFPDLKIVVSHGGGAAPYQLGRFESGALRSGRRFSEGMRKLYFDTVLYTEGALRLLIETVGPDRCLFGSECPGVGSRVNPDTGRTFDDVRSVIDGFDWLSAEDKHKIFEGNARKVFNLDSA
jgi:predicted TIM-barrel fold metal-dependent hydrolase